MLPVNLNTTQLNLDTLPTLTLTLTLPTEPEQEKPNIVILKKKVQSNSTELF